MAAYLAGMFGVSLAVTILTELVVAMLYRRICRLKGRWGYKRNLALLVLLVNLLTNPPAVLFCWLGRIYLPSAPALLIQILVEIVVVAVEAKVYLGFSQKAGWQVASPLGLAVAANLCSWVLGFVAGRYLWLFDVLGLVLENMA